MEEEEHLAIASLNSCFKKKGHSMILLYVISLRKFILTGRFAAGIIVESFFFFLNQGFITRGA